MESRFRDDPNVQMLTRVAVALGELREQLVFLGGCATSSLITAVRAESVRATKDVDAVVEAVSAAEYHLVERKLAAKGFVPDTSPEAPICRRIRDGVRLDVMPSNPRVLGFANRWYPLAISSSTRVALDEAVSIRLVTAPVFVATKLEAFHGRGRQDYFASHDLEDLLSVVDGRAELLDEMLMVDHTLRDYISSEFRRLLADAEFLAALPGHLPADAGAQARLPGLLARLREIAAKR